MHGMQIAALDQRDDQHHDDKKEQGNGREKTDLAGQRPGLQFLRHQHADGDVDGEDFLQWQLQFEGEGGAAATALPEITSLALLAVVAATAGSSRRRNPNRD